MVCPLSVPLCTVWTFRIKLKKKKNTQQKIKLLPLGQGRGVVGEKKSLIYKKKKRIFSPREGNSHPFLQDENSPLYIRSSWMDTAWPAGPGASPWLSSSSTSAVIVPAWPGSQAEQSNRRSAPPKLTRPASWAAHAHLAVLVQEMPAGFSVLSVCPVQAADGAKMKLY